MARSFTSLKKGNKVWRVWIDDAKSKVMMVEHTVKSVCIPIQPRPTSTVAICFNGKFVGFAADYADLHYKTSLVTYSYYYFTDGNEAKAKYAELWDQQIKVSGLKVKEATKTYDRWLENWKKSGMPV